MKVTDAAFQVLSETDQPLTVSEITKRIISQGLWVAKGKTPEQTVSAALSVDVSKNGNQSRFIHAGTATYGINPLFVGHAQREKTKLKQEQLVLEISSPKTFSFTDAAEKILDGYGNHQPMHYQTITDKALQLQLISTKGLTPAATMYAQIITEIERKRKRGEKPRFVMHGKGLVGLSSWESQGLTNLIENHNREIRKKLLQKLQDMPAKEFEKLIALLLARLGFEEVTVTPYSGDKGIDVRAILVVGETIRTRMAVQVKKWKTNVQGPVIQQVRGSLSTHEQGLIITTSNFSPGAVKEARQADKIPVALMNGVQLVDLLIENNIGVIRTAYDLIELAETELETQ